MEAGGGNDHGNIRSGIPTPSIKYASIIPNSYTQEHHLKNGPLYYVS